MKNMKNNGIKLSVLKEIIEKCENNENRSYLVEKEKKLSDSDTSTSAKYPSICFDLENVKASMESWKRYVLSNYERRERNYFFLTFHLCGFFHLSKIPSQGDDFVTYISEIMTKSRPWAKERKEFAGLFYKDNIKKTFIGQEITEGALMIRILYEANRYLFQLLDITHDNKQQKKTTVFLNEMENYLFSEDFQTITPELKKAYKKEKKEKKKNDPIKIYISGILLTFNIDEKDICHWLYTTDSTRPECFNQDIDIFLPFESGLFYQQILSKTGILGSLGSLQMLYYGNQFCENQLNNIDIHTLLTCADIFYYNSINSMITDGLQRAFVCSYEAYRRGERAISAYNLGYYHYEASKGTSSRFENLKLDGPNGNADISLAVNYFKESCDAKHGPSFNSLGNIVSNKKLLQDKEDTMKILEEYANCFCSTPIDKTLSYEQKCSHISFTFYKEAAKHGSLDGMYNYCRSIEKKLDSVNLNKSEQKLLLNELASSLKYLKNFRHPKGTNLFLQYFIYELAYKDVKNNYSFTREFLFQNKDLIPDIYKSKKVIRKNVFLDLTSPSDLRDRKDIINLYEYISSYKYDQLIYFWPVYHFCLLKLNDTSSMNKDEYEKIRRLLCKIITPHILAKENYTLEQSEDVHKAYLLLLKLANREDNAIYERQYIYQIYRNDIKKIIDLEKSLSNKIHREYDKLKSDLSHISAHDVNIQAPSDHITIPEEVVNQIAFLVKLELAKK